jgi:alginate O-acetyltransferase complex protein AlgI
MGDHSTYDGIHAAVLFNSYIFLFAFLPISLAGFFVLARLGRSVASGWLIAASLVFYGWWNPAFLPLLLVSILGNFVVSRVLLATAGRAGLQGWLLAGAVGLNLAALVHYKYLAAVLGFLRLYGVTEIEFADPALPLGISFFTFTQIGYLLDCRGLSPAVRRGSGWLDYALFVTFFPHLIAGPILHHREILPQFAVPQNFSPIARNLGVGLGFFTLGLLKKCLLADPTGVVVAPGFAQADMLALFAAWQVALSYSLQLYFDFSGYSDMAVGLARMFNLRFPVNFNSPYKACSVIDYWQRWHITLTRYLTQYLFNPLTMALLRHRAARGSPIGRAAQASAAGFFQMLVLPLCMTMGLAGIWHGAGWTFLVFGLLHGFFLSINHAWKIFGHAWTLGWTAGWPSERSVAVFSVGLTYLSVLMGAVFFRAPSLPAAFDLLAGMAGMHGTGLAIPADPRAQGRLALDLLWLGLLYAIVWGAPNSQEIMGETAKRVTAWRWQPSLPWAVGFGVAAAVGLLSVGGTGEFLYFQF